MALSTSGKFGTLVRLIRPKQWIKNFFVFAPLIFSKQLFDIAAFLATLQAFAAFSLAASAVYVLNDITDVEADRAHPEKRHRPLASGLLSVREAGIALGFLAAATGALLLGMPPKFAAVVATYVLINIWYSLKLKEVVLLDVFIIAAGFMLRVLGGAYAIRVQLSSWIVLCSLFISLFLGFAKRRSEVVLMAGTEGQKRKVLSLYKVEFIDQMLTIAAAGAVISYALYTVAPRTMEVFGTDKMLYTTVFVLYGVFRYLYLIHTSPSIENPTHAVTSDRSILITGILWIVACVVLIYARQSIPWMG